MISVGFQYRILLVNLLLLLPDLPKQLAFKYWGCTSLVQECPVLFFICGGKAQACLSTSALLSTLVLICVFQAQGRFWDAEKSNLEIL